MDIIGGYDSAVPNKDLEKFSCSICTKIYRDPHITKCCGQHFCESCLNNWFTNYGKDICPYCRAKKDEFQHFLDKKFQRKIALQIVYCTNKKEGCQWDGMVGSLKYHLKRKNGCAYVKVQCPYKCRDVTQFPFLVQQFYRRDIENHIENECPLRPYRCKFCGLEDSYAVITGDGSNLFIGSNISHYNVCPEFPLECGLNCGAKDIKRKDLENHCSQCPEKPVACPFEEVGCEVVLVRKELEQHMSTTQQQHLLLVMEAYKEMKEEKKELKTDYDEANYDLYQVKQQCATLRKTVEESLTEIKRRNEATDIIATRVEYIEANQKYMEQHQEQMRQTNVTVLRQDLDYIIQDHYAAVQRIAQAEYEMQNMCVCFSLCLFTICCIFVSLLFLLR